MANFSIIADNIVVNVIVADTLADAQEVTPEHFTIAESDVNVIPGWTYDGTNFAAPIIPGPDAQETQGVSN